MLDPTMNALRRAPVRIMPPSRPPDVPTTTKPPVMMPPPVMPQPGAPPPDPHRGQNYQGPYNNPTMRQQSIFAQNMPQAMPAMTNSPQYDAALAVAQEQAKARLAQAASRYGQMRLNQLGRVQHLLPPDLQAQLQGLPMVDPAAAWRAISGSFAAAAQNAGYADPRMWLTMLLRQPPVMGGQAEY